MDDVALVERQLGRAPRAFRRVAVRCPFGRPAVTEQAPVDENGSPFPTTYWLTCPFLVAQVSRLEAAGGVDRWTRAVAEDDALAQSPRHAGVERWGRDAVAERAPYEGWPRDVSLVEDAAFHVYSRGAVDFEP